MKSETTPKRVFRNLSYLAFIVLALSLLVEIAQGEEHQRLAPERRRPLHRVRSWLRGTDLTIRGIPQNGRRMAASCQSTPVAKKELDSPEGMCRLAYLTAAHCVDSPFESIDFLGIGQVQKSSMKVSIPQEYFQRGGQNSREPKGGDSATLIFDVSCEKAESVIPVPLAPVDSQGQTIINANKVYLQKRQEQAQGNRGEGAQIQADVRGTEGPMFKFYAPSPQGYAIVGGDSGGPIFNDKGQLVCPISGSEYEAKRENGQLTRLPDGNPDTVLDPFTVVCDRRAIARLRADLAKFGLSPTSSGDAEDLSEQAAQNPRPLLGNAGGSGTQLPFQQPQQRPQQQQARQPVYNGYQFEPVQNRAGLHYRRPEDPSSEPTEIFLKRMPDGSRKAARRHTDGSLTFLSQDAEDGLRQFYRANQNKLSSLSDKQRQYVTEFLRGTPSVEERPAPPTPEPTGPSQTPRQLPSIDHAGGTRSAGPGPNPGQLNNGNFRNALPPTTGSVPTDHKPEPDLEKQYGRARQTKKDESPLHSAIGRCIDCHGAGSGRKLILPGDPEEALKALSEKLSKTGPINPEMVMKMAESSIHGSLSKEEKEALYQHLFGTTDLKEIAKLEEPQQLPPQEMDPTALAELRGILPKTTNPFLDSILASPSTKFYTDKDRPAVYQVDKDTLGAGEGIKFRDSAENVGRLGWKDLFRQSVETAKTYFRGLLGAPAGLQSASDADYKTIKFIRNPSENGKTTPTDITSIPSGIDSHKIDWKFPEGTVVGEIVMVKDPTTGKDKVLQVRTRTKTGDKTWQPDIYQAFPTAKSFADRIKSVYSDGAWERDPELKRMVEHLERSQKMPTKSVASDYSIPVYSGNGGVDELPDLAPDKVARLLNGATLDSSLNKRWRTDGQTESFAPTTKSDFHIVPKNYEAHTLEVSESSCMRCHQNAGTNFGVINPHAKRNDGAQFAPPDAYGSIYGRDGIFSWHPFSSDRSAYQNFGNGVKGAKTDNRYDRNGRLMLQPGWIQSGLIQLLSPQRR